MKGRWRACIAELVVVVTCGFGRAAAQPLTIDPGVVDDRVVKAATICANGKLDAVDVALTDDGSVSSKGTVKGWCLTGDYMRVSDSAEVLLATIALCSGDGRDLSAVSKADGTLVDNACAGKAKLSRADALRLAGMVRSRSERSFFDVSAILPVGPEATAGALTTTTDIVARATASFLEKRAKAEFKEFILRRLRTKICVDLKLQRWLSSTCAYLGTAEDDTTLPLSLGTGLRSALLQDATDLPDHVIANLLTPAESTPGDAALLLARTGFESGLALVRHRDPSFVAAVLEGLARDARFCAASDQRCLDVKALLAIVGRALAIIRAGQLGTAEASSFAIAARFLVEQLKADPAVAPHLVDLSNFLVDADGKLHRLLAAANALADATRKLGKAIEAPIDHEPDGEVQHARDVASQAADVISRLDILANATSELIANAKVKNAIAALRDQLAYAGSLVTALAQADLAKEVTLILTRIAADRDLRVKLPGAVTRVLSFAVDLATAKDAKEAEAVLEGIAAPVGAWQGKLEDTVFSISGFVGATLGHESTRVDGADVKTSSIGPIAALGFDINLPGKLSPFLQYGARPGVFLSVIDVGALLSYSYDTPSQTAGDKSSQAGQTTPIGFTQIFSPGAFLRLGVSNTPIVVGGGVSFLPRGRSITTTESAADGAMTTQDRSTVRWSLFLAIDVTLLPF